MALLWLLHSISLIVGSGLLACTLALPTAIAWAKFSSSKSAGLSSWLSQSLVAGMLFIPLYVQACGWSAGFGALGWWTVSQVTAAQNILHGLFAVIWIHGIGAFPIAAWLLYVGLVRIPAAREEAAMIDGGFWHVVRFAWWPTIVRWISLGFLATAALVAGDMLVTNLYRVPTLTEQCYMAAAAGEKDWWSWIGSSFPALLLGLLAYIFFPTFINPNRPKGDDRESFVGAKGVSFQSGRVLAWIFQGLMWFATCLALGVPLLNLLIKLGWDPRLIDGKMERGWSVVQATKSIQGLEEFSEEFGWTLELTTLASIVAIALAWSLGRWSVGSTNRARCAVSCALFMLALPGPVIGLTVKRLCESLPGTLSDAILDRSLIAPLVAIQFRCLPIALLPMMIAWHRWREAVGDAVRLDGLSYWQEGKSFLLGNYRLLIAIGLLTLAVATAELSSYLLVLPAGVTPIAMRIFELLHYGVRYKEAGLCIVLAFVGMIVGSVARFLSMPIQTGGHSTSG